jgi:bilirubin oxidase
MNGAMDMRNMVADLGPVKLQSENALPAGGALRDLPKLANESSQAGHFKATLIAAPHGVALLPGRPTIFWAYNGSVPGPLIEVFEGDSVEITFVNRLRQPSSIHWHGMPVPPDQDGNPEQMVPPGGSRTYRFQLPAGSAGTYWYHPHPHHYTAEQVFRGLAGAFIVRPRHDPLAGIPERLLMVSDLKLDSHGAITPNDHNDWMNGREGQFVLVNGQKRPVLHFNAGGRERWRVWNACSARYLRLHTPGSTLTLVGTDGGLIEQPQAGMSEYLLAPGQRAELIVHAQGRHNQSDLIAAISPRGKMGSVAPDRQDSLLTEDFAAVGTASLPPLPAQLTTIADLGPTVARKQVVFSEEMSMQNGQHTMRFLINNKQFDMKRVDLVSRVGEVELWEIINRADMDHPFHLHGTQFQVVERELDGVVKPEPFRAWRDTVNLRSGETVRIKTTQHWRGIRMFHCHILEHEDKGMMGQLRVI